MNTIVKLLLFVVVSLHMHPSNADWFTHDRALSAAEQGKWKEASGLLQQALTKNPQDPSTLYNAGVAAFREKDYAQAKAYFNDAATQKNASDDLTIKSLFNAGRTCIETKELYEARDKFKKVLELDPNNEPARTNLKIVEKMLEQEKKKEEEKKEQQQQNDNQDNQDQNNQDQRQKDEQQQQDEQSKKEDNQSKQDKQNQQNDQRNQQDQQDSQDGNEQEQQGDNSQESNNDKKNNPRDQQSQEQQSQKDTAQGADKKQGEQKQQQEKSGKQEQEQQRAEQGKNKESQQQHEAQAANESDKKPEPQVSPLLAKIMQQQEDQDRQVHQQLLKTRAGMQRISNHEKNSW